ncbi:MAG: RHS repeat-associated core domain-containing protein [bacterium]
MKITHDNVGNRTSKTITDGQGQYVWGYEYDALYRLVTETYPDTHTVTYTYDSNGNRLTRTENGNTINSVYDNADQLLTAGPLEFSYDGNGNQVQKIDHSQGDATTGFMYDYENLLAQITFPDTTTENYLYNGNGPRVQKTRSGITTDYLLSGSDVLNEWSSQGGPPPTYYILGGSMAGPIGLMQPGDPDPVYHYSHTDGLGSIHMLTDDPANITDGYCYDAFGVGMTPPNPPPNTTYNPYRYTGQQKDFSSELTYLRARYYDPSMGRFQTQDPIGFNGGMNFYAYCGGNPGNFIDLTGKETGWVTIQPYEPPAPAPPNPNILVINMQGELNAPGYPLGGSTSITIYIDITTGDYVMTTSYGVGIGPGIGGISSIEIGQTAAPNIEDASYGNFLTNINVSVSGFLANGGGFSGTFTGTYVNQTSTAGGGLGSGMGLGVNISLITNRRRGNLHDLLYKGWKK